MDKLIPIRPRVDEHTYAKWMEDGFELEMALSSISGPVIEIGGPTYGGYSNIFPDSEFVNILPDGRKILVSNRKYWKVRRDPVADPFVTEEELAKIKPPEGVILKKDLDFMCDGGRMPFANGAIGAILFSHLGRIPFFGGGPTMATIKESARVLEPGGLLIAQSVNNEEINFAKELGFNEKIVYRGEDGYKFSDVVFQR